MDDSRVAKCTYGAGTLMLILSSTTTFDWVSNELCSRFKLKLGHFELRYSFMDCSNCLLESDDDLKIMFMKFEGGVCEFRDKLAKYSVENGFKMKYLKNEPRRVTAVCAKKESNGCEWHVHAAKSNRKFVANPLVRPIELITDLKENYVLDIPYHVAWYGKELATKDLHGDEELSYAHLPWYVDVLKASNVRSHCVLDCGEDSSHFQWIFICFKASIDGFRWCRPMLFIDGTFVTNKYKEVFPFAFVIVSGETVDNWRWILQRISEVLVDKGRQLTFIYDRHGAIINVVRTVFLAFPHGFCLYHLKENLKKKYPHSVGSSFKDHILWIFLKLLYAPTIEEYQHRLKKLRDDGGPTIIDKFLADLPVQNFANAFFPGKRYGDVSNALSESFNSWVKDVRRLPNYEMIDTIRVKMMEMISRRKLASEKWCSVLCPVIEDELKNLAAKGCHWRICRASESIFEVHADLSVMVNLDERFCSCYQWQLLRFPCQHAIQVIQHSGLCLYDFVDEYYKADFYKATYATPIFPIHDIEKTPPGDVFLLPPHT
ncbi:uncharacterized protein LOC110772604 [Prunus avium]|uniref:Uncharacterized protein LOC110772604 n=1 Tax=Prunus avium TaxID=42229 RepID=A0A6P5TZZ2_PRUAV|nr:uncharacterized protein LOC110772604 [Prunus avium]